MMKLHGNAKDKTGQRFGRLTVIREASRVQCGNGRNIRAWECLCDCGNTTIKTAVYLSPYRSGKNELGCGCSRAEKTIARCTKHGLAKRGEQPKEYGIWKTMRRRCEGGTQDRQYYTERGITVCPEWEDFATFIADMGFRPSPQHSLDRIDNDKGYSKDNCRWATPVEQRRNQRRYIEQHGVDA